MRDNQSQTQNLRVLGRIVNRIWHTSAAFLNINSLEVRVRVGAVAPDQTGVEQSSLSPNTGVEPSSILPAYRLVSMPC